MNELKRRAELQEKLQRRAELQEKLQKKEEQVREIVKKADMDEVKLEDNKKTTNILKGLFVV